MEYDQIKIVFNYSDSKEKVSEGQSDLRHQPRLKQKAWLETKTGFQFLKLPKLMKNSILKDGSIISVMDAPIDRIELFKFNSEVFFEISGYGGCSSCNEYSSIFTLNGKNVFENYYSKDTVLYSYFDSKYEGVISRHRRVKMATIHLH